MQEVGRSLTAFHVRDAPGPVTLRYAVAARRGASYTGTMDIASLRKSYERDELDETASAADPIDQFQRWFDQALNA